MSALLLVILALALIAMAAAFLVLAILRPRDAGRDLAFAVLMIGLALGVWYTAIRTPAPLP
ncbi:MAG: hypothetical protein ACRDGE_11440 [Candidatus Limnocylindria bacterium]